MSHEFLSGTLNEVRRFLVGAVYAAVFTPLIFYLETGEIGAVAWGVTVFLVMLCLLGAVGSYGQSRRELATSVALADDWLDRLAAFWLVACAFGPLAGWFVVQVVPLTVVSWPAIYAFRVMLALGMPLITALPLLRYLRGRGALLMLIIWVIVTAVPAATAVPSLRDLWQGPISLEVQLHNDGHCTTLPLMTAESVALVCTYMQQMNDSGPRYILVLPHTGHILSLPRR